MTRRVLTVLAIAVALVGIGAAGVLLSGSSTGRFVVSDGVPMQIHMPDRGDRIPAVVVAHGFAGSGRLMRGFADTLVKNGYAAVLIDFAGHGSNARRLPPEGVARDRALEADVRTAVERIRREPRVDPSRVALVGHSMGARVATRYAAGDPSIVATVAISLGGGSADLPRDAARPRNLLLLYGAAEFGRFRTGALDALRVAAPEGDLGTTYGNPNLGTARRAIEVPGTEHISVLFSARTHREMVTWLDAATGEGVGEPNVAPRERLLWAGVLLAGVVLGLYPLAVLLLRGSPASAPQRMPRRWFAVGLVMAVGVALPLALVLPTAWLPLAVGDYTLGYFIAVGLVLAGAYKIALLGRSAAEPAPRPAAGPSRSLLLILYAVPAVAVPVHLGLTWAFPVGARWWLLPIGLASAAVLLWATELVAAGRSARRVVVLTTVAAGLLGGALVGVAPGFVTLVLPLLVFLLAWHAAWAAVLRRQGAPSWLIAGTGAVLLAWPVVTTLPVIA